MLSVLTFIYLLLASGNEYIDYYYYYMKEYLVDIVNDLLLSGANLDIQNNAGETAAIRGSI